MTRIDNGEQGKEEGIQMKMCLNWKVTAALGSIVLGVLVFDPHLLGAALPLLLLALCPLSMVAMMFAMRGMGGMRKDQRSMPRQLQEAGPARPERQFVQLRSQLAEIETQRATVTANIRALDETETAGSSAATKPRRLERWE